MIFEENIPELMGSPVILGGIYGRAAGTRVRQHA